MDGDWGSIGSQLMLGVVGSVIATIAWKVYERVSARQAVKLKKAAQAAKAEQAQDVQDLCVQPHLAPFLMAREIRNRALGFAHIAMGIVILAFCILLAGWATGVSESFRQVALAAGFLSFILGGTLGYLRIRTADRIGVAMEIAAAVLRSGSIPAAPYDEDHPDAAKR